LLTNGDFTVDADAIGEATDANVVMNPTGWTFTGTGTNYGLWNTSHRGGTGWYYGMADRNPVGGDISAFTTDMVAGDPNGVLSQTASATAVSGQTYYAMGYVMTYCPNSIGDGEWWGWNDTATMEIVIDNTVKATFSRRLSRDIWRALYGTYTAVPADAGKAVEIRFSYTNSFTKYYAKAGYMEVGYAYLGTSMPNEWPEKRSNRLTNGGFEDLSTLQTAIPAAYAALNNAADSNGAWFVTGMPTTSVLPSWIYEVPTGYSLDNQGGIFNSGFFASPIPSPGMNDIVVYGSGTMVYGQIVGALTSGTTYNLDMACGVLVEPQTWGVVTVTWPSPEPKLNIELWRIPAGVTDPAAIHTGITTLASGYVKIAGADVNSTGDIKRDNYKWQIVGTSYTATSSDTNVYVRIYGTNPITSGTTYPSFVFSDVYLSTQKRLVAGGSLLTNISSGVQYDTLGPYNTYQASLMNSYAADANGDSVVNFVDFAIMAENWLKPVFLDSTGATYN
jgi:hypothetical protein